MPAPTLPDHLADLVPELADGIAHVVEAAKRDPEVARLLAENRAVMVRWRAVRRASRSLAREMERDNPGLVRLATLDLAAVLPPDIEARARKVSKALHVLGDE